MSRMSRPGSWMHHGTTEREHQSPVGLGRYRRLIIGRQRQLQLPSSMGFFLPRSKDGDPQILFGLS